ncbi:MAG: hypothetical protein JJU00_14340 [Opitutales bacterium]|nr:hypothetical protein [Opitutales bacterium]
MTPVGALAFCALAAAYLWLLAGGAAEWRFSGPARVGLGIFFSLFAAAGAGAALFMRRELGRPVWRALRAAGFWELRWLGWVGLAVAAGAVAGTVLFALAWTLLPLERELAGMLAQGARDGAFYVFIWAPGGAFILCVIEARRRAPD